MPIVWAPAIVVSVSLNLAEPHFTWLQKTRHLSFIQASYTLRPAQILWILLLPLSLMTRLFFTWRDAMKREQNAILLPFPVSLH